jgi:hypothetical protein
MTPAVVDTDVVSYLFKGDSRADRYLPSLLNRELLISFMTEAELEQWTVLAGWSPPASEHFGVTWRGLACTHRRVWFSDGLTLPSAHDEQAGGLR